MHPRRNDVVSMFGNAPRIRSSPHPHKRANVHAKAIHARVPDCRACQRCVRCAGSRRGSFPLPVSLLACDFHRRGFRRYGKNGNLPLLGGGVALLFPFSRRKFASVKSIPIARAFISAKVVSLFISTAISTFSRSSGLRPVT
jgi:hypothetical protein